MDLHSLLGTLHYSLSLYLSLARASCVVWGMHVCSQKEGWNKKGVTFLVPCWCSFVGERNNFSILKSHSIFLSFFLLKGYCLVILLYEAMSHEGRRVVYKVGIGNSHSLHYMMVKSWFGFSVWCLVGCFEAPLRLSALWAAHSQFQKLLMRCHVSL